jgi:hypothetical protein
MTSRSTADTPLSELTDSLIPQAAHAMVGAELARSVGVVTRRRRSATEIHSISTPNSHGNVATAML